MPALLKVDHGTLRDAGVTRKIAAGEVKGFADVPEEGTVGGRPVTVLLSFLSFGHVPLPGVCSER